MSENFLPLEFRFNKDNPAKPMTNTRFTSRLRHLAATSLLILAPVSVFAEQAPAAPGIDAKAWILIDYASGKVLTESSADQRLDPASLTKMMTSYVVGQAIKAGKIKPRCQSHCVSSVSIAPCAVVTPWALGAMPPVTISATPSRARSP